MEHQQSDLNIAFVRENVDSNLWWPAIVGNNFGDIMKTFERVEGEKEKARFTSQYCVDTNFRTAYSKIARLMNPRKHPNKRMCLLVVEEDESTLIKGFYDHIAMEDMNESAPATDGFNNGMQQALQWQIGNLEKNHAPIMDSPGGALYNVEAPITPETSQLAKHDSSQMEEPTESQPKSNAQEMMENDSKMSCLNVSNGEKACSTPTTRSTKNKNLNTAIAVAANQTGFKGPDTSSSSHPSGKQVTPSNKKIMSSKKGNAKKTVRKIKKNDEWKTVLEILEQKYDWEVRLGKGLINYYYVPGDLATLHIDDIIANYKAGKDYYINEQQVMQIAQRRYKWRGPGIDRGKAKALTPIPKDGEWPHILSKIEYNLGLVFKGKGHSRIKKEYDNMKWSDIEAQLVEDVDYFHTEEGLKDFAYKHCGWRGPPGKEYAPVVSLNNGLRNRDAGKRAASKMQGILKPAPSKASKNTKKKDEKIALRPTESKTSSTMTPPSWSENANQEQDKEQKINSLTPIPKDGEWPHILSRIEYNLGLVFKGHSRIKEEYDNMKWSDIEAQLVEDVDYFRTEEGLKDFAYKHCGWRGPPGKEYAPMDIQNNGHRNKRHRDSRRHDHLNTSPLKKTCIISKETIVQTFRADTSSSKIATVGKKNAQVKKARTTSLKAVAKKVTKKKTNPSVKTKSPLRANKKSPKKVTKKSPKKAVAVTKDAENKKNTALTLNERLVQCSTNMDASCAPESLLFDGMNTTSTVSDTKKKILSFFKGCFDLERKHSNGESSFLYICGRPGTGKVRAVRVKKFIRCVASL